MLYDPSSPALSPSPSLPSTPSPTPYSSPPSPFPSQSPSLSSSASPTSGSPASSIHASTKHILLPGAAFSTEPFLSKLATGLEQGGGGLALLAVQARKAGASDDAVEALEDAFAAFGRVQNVDGELWSAPSLCADGWEKVGVEFAGEPTAYFVASENAHGKSDEGLNVPLELDDILSDAAKDEPLDDAAFLHTLGRVGLRRVLDWTSADANWTLHLLERPPISFPPLSLSLSLPSGYTASDVEGVSVASSMKSLTSTPANPFGVPTLAEWHGLWAAWDLVTLGMIPTGMLHDKPIDLRHKCLFYIGHIPTFLDMLLSKALKEPNTEPKNYTVIFERGIDPHVDDPDHCHNHSEVPEKDEDWPTLNAILAFRDRVRARLHRLYDDLESGKRTIGRRLARTLMMTLEHEGFHVETLLYMLIQRAGTGTLPPRGFTPPPWSTLAAQWSAAPKLAAGASTTLGPATVVLGHDDSEADDAAHAAPDDVAAHEFGWDNESPARAVRVGRFRVEWRPVTNGAFEAFWRAGGAKMPGSWLEEDGVVKVRTMYGPVSLDVAKDWPVLTAYDDLAAYARAKGGRLPTEPELRLFLDTFDVGHDGGANVGFRNWHPVPATMGGEKDGGRGSNGGVWEWTSDLFDAHDGMVPTDLFPGYSTDFFDGKHHVVLGASYATIPRIAGRRTIRNFYQHNYPYPWVGARVVYDA